MNILDTALPLEKKGLNGNVIDLTLKTGKFCCQVVTFIVFLSNKRGVHGSSQ